jgi:hypothetical protein
VAVDEEEFQRYKSELQKKIEREINESQISEGKSKKVKLSLA